jgi:hypothetical protein
MVVHLIDEWGSIHVDLRALALKFSMQVKKLIAMEKNTACISAAI